MSDMPNWIVLRFDLQCDAWREVACTAAPDPGSAFRTVVLGANDDRSPVGEYRIFQLEGHAHLGVELTLRDLAQEQNPKAVA